MTNGLVPDVIDGTCDSCGSPAGFRFLDCADCREARTPCREIVCVACGKASSSGWPLLLTSENSLNAFELARLAMDRLGYEVCGGLLCLLDEELDALREWLEAQLNSGYLIDGKWEEEVSE